jgi:phosphate transport system protein
MSDHILKRFDELLDKLSMRVISMGSLVQEQVVESIHALERHDVALAQRVIERDDRIDKYDVKIDKLCMKLFALQQPVAMDLRVVLSAMRINRNLERISDYTVNIAQAVLQSVELSRIVRQTELLTMAQQAQRMVFDALQAFIHHDVDLARTVASMDDEVDDLNDKVFMTMVDIMREHPDLVEPCSLALLIARDVERLADESTNIAEEVVFVVDAKIVKHKPWIDDEDAPDTAAEASPGD